MNNFKVRAWDSDRKEMYTSPKWVEFLVDRDGVLTAQNYDRGGKLQSLEVTQFSGWSDDAGNEWYAGDICESRDDNDTSWFEIVFQNGAFRMKFSEWDNVLEEYNIITLMHTELYTKIGNRFENPELIK